MFSAFVAIPAAYFTFRLEGSTDSATMMLRALLQVSGTLLFVVIARYMKKLLNVRFAFHDTDRNIDLMIMANVAAGVLVLAGFVYPPLKETLGIAALVIIVFLGIVQIRFGYRLLKLPDDLAGMLKPFCYSNIATGICIASVFLLLVGVVVSAISDLMLGTIFFSLARQAGEAESDEGGI
jgi:hypothetical protein